MEKKKKLKIAVLMGGHSAERDISIMSGKGVIDGLIQAGHDVIGVDPAFGKIAVNSPEKQAITETPPSTTDLSKLDTATTIQTVSSSDLKNVDVVFIALHGGMGENGTIQALLDMLNIPYTGSGVLASAIGLDKIASKRIVQAAGVPTPDYLIISSDNLPDEKSLIDEINKTIGFPLVVKPNDQGSSVGLNISKSADDIYEYINTAANYSAKVLLEQFIEGRELTVAILGDKPLPVAEVIPEGGFYDYHHKYTPGLADKKVPAPLTDEEAKTVQNLALTAFQALGCRGFARIDFRLSPDGNWYFLEANTLPGMTATSLVPKAAKADGIGFPELLDKIVHLAYDYHMKANKK